MSFTGNARNSLLASLVLVVLCSAGALNASAASAEGLGAITGPVTEAVTRPLREVVEAVPPPVEEVTETATAPVQEATQVSPPAQEVTEAATAPVEAVKETVTPTAEAVTGTLKPAAKAVTGTVAPAGKGVTETVRRFPPPPSVKLPSAPVTEGAEETTQAAGEGITGTVLPTSSRASSHPGPDPTTSKTGSPQGLADGGSVAPLSVDRPGARQGNLFVPPPAVNGSTEAPPPRWLAYVWPAIALLRPGLTDLVDRWEGVVRVALGTSEGFGERTGIGPFVAGAHASGGQPEPGDSASPSSASSPFEKITSAVGDFPYNEAGATLAYIVIVAIMLIALYVAVRWEMAQSRRERHW